MADKPETIEQYPVKNRWSGEVSFTAEISVTPDMAPSIKLGLAVKWGIKNGADLSDADLYGADLSRADLYSANLSRADLYGADLSDADLSRADLSRANLSRADLSRANLYSANLYSANLSRADLSRANLYSANLYSANLYGADLSDAKNAGLAIARTRILPEGSLIGWKKCQAGVIVKLRIPENSPRSHAFGRKCRAQFVDVLEVHGAEHGVSIHDGETTYRPGERVECDRWDENWTSECAGGLHFYLSRIEAEAH